MDYLSQFFWKVKSMKPAQLFTVYLRYLIGAAIMIAAIGMGKLSGIAWNDSTPIEQLFPIQQFFKVISLSGLYWKFIGWSQIIAGLLLVTKRFAKAGALLFFGIILNIFIITVFYDFTGTPIVNELMLLATSYLVIWDFDSLKYIFIKPSADNLPGEPEEHQFWIILGTIIISIVVVAMILKIPTFIVMISALAVGLLGLIYFMFRYKRPQRITETEITNLQVKYSLY